MDKKSSETKKVFTTAHKSKKSIEVKNSEDKKETVNEVKVKIEKNTKIKTEAEKITKVKTENKKPITTEKPNETAEGDSVSEEKKNLRKRNKSKKKTTETNKSSDDLCKEMKEIILSAEAAPFVPAVKAEELTVKPHNKQNKQNNVSVRRPVSRPKPKEEDLRKVEVNQLRIRFSPTGFTVTALDDSIVMQCVMPITDPEFSYDLDTVRLEIVLPRGYPGTKSIPIRPCFSILNSDLPSAIIARIERNLKWGLNSLDGGILVCRPMLRYLEENLEKWMVDDVRESAFKFVKPGEIKVTEKPPESTSDSASDEDEYDKVTGNNNITFTNVTGTTATGTQTRFSKGDWLAPGPVTDQSAVGGISFTLKLVFSTIRGIDLLTSQRLTFLAACDRCKFNFPVEDLRPFVDRIEHCPKCTNQTKFYYKGQLVTPGSDHEGDEGYEAILGSVRFLRAKPVDLLPSLYQCACSRCYGTETETETVSNLSSCKIEKVKVGESINYNCFNCHYKIRFQIDRIEWISDAVFCEKQAKRPVSKTGPVLSVGTPLPQNGACEHYKKSFRWYRFPCCGQAFPCDECHAKDPVAKDHPVEWATRFICGFCSREQSINIKECPECGRDTSASARKFTSFWEGGKGTRNQVLMNRKDSKKYKNYSTSTIKTKPKPTKKQSK